MAKVNKNSQGERSVEINFKQLLYVIPVIGSMFTMGGAGIGNWLSVDIFHHGAAATVVLLDEQIDDLKSRNITLETQRASITKNYIKCLSFGRLPSFEDEEENP